MLDFPKIYSDEALQQVLEDVLPIARKLPKGISVDSESLFLAAVWTSRKIGQRSIMGMQIRRLVKTGDLPMLILLNEQSKGPKRYRVI